MTTERDLGRYEEKINAIDARMCRVESTVDGLDEKLDRALEVLAERRGERKAIAILATAAGGAGSLVITLLLKLWEHK